MPPQMARLRGVEVVSEAWRRVTRWWAPGLRGVDVFRACLPYTCSLLTSIL